MFDSLEQPYEALKCHLCLKPGTALNPKPCAVEEGTPGNLPLDYESLQSKKGFPASDGINC